MTCPQTMGCWFPHEAAVASFDGHKTSEIVLWVSYEEITVGTTTLVQYTTVLLYKWVLHLSTFTLE